MQNKQHLDFKPTILDYYNKFLKQIQLAVDLNCWNWYSWKCNQ